MDLVKKTDGQWGIGVNLTTNGVGINIAKSVHSKNKVIAKLEGAYLPLSISNYEYAVGTSQLLVNSSINLGSIGLYFDWHPFSNSFKLTGGLAYMFTNITGNAVFKDSVIQGEIKLSPSEIGNIDIKLKTMPIVPYLGLGFGRSIPKTRVNIGFDIGAYYISSPLLTFKCSGMLEPTSDQEKRLNDNLSVNKLLPTIRLNLNIKL
ncbi:MAG: hypothetical protein K9G64_05130 [Bacteroidia bacterium]|nr:hypothetical protein [Bacteroidia bacterium]